MNIKYSVKKQLVKVEVYIYYLIFLNLIAFALESVKEFDAYMSPVEHF